MEEHVRTRENARIHATDTPRGLTTALSLGTRSMLAAWIALLGLCFSAPAAVAQLALPDTAGVTLSAGDVLRITVWRQPEMSGEFVVGADGSILHPLYRTIRVANLPLSTVEDRVRTFLARFESNPEFVL